MAEEYDGLTVEEALRAEAAKEILTDDEPSDIELVRDELGIDGVLDPLSALLDAPAGAPVHDVPLRRLGTMFTVTAITDDRAYDKLVERCTSYRRNRRGGQRTREVDGRRLARLTVAEYCLNPRFKPDGGAGFESLAVKYGTREPEDLVDRALLMGEIDLLADTVLSLSGFDDEVETAGN